MCAFLDKSRLGRSTTPSYFIVKRTSNVSVEWPSSIHPAHPSFKASLGNSLFRESEPEFTSPPECMNASGSAYTRSKYVGWMSTLIVRPRHHTDAYPTTCLRADAVSNRPHPSCSRRLFECAPHVHCSLAGLPKCHPRYPISTYYILCEQSYYHL